MNYELTADLLTKIIFDYVNKGAQCTHFSALIKWLNIWIVKFSHPPWHSHEVVVLIIFFFRSLNHEMDSDERVYSKLRNGVKLERP